MTAKPKLTQEIVEYLMGQKLIYLCQEYFSDGESDLMLYVRSFYGDHRFLWVDRSIGDSPSGIGNAREMSLEEARKVYKERLAERIKKMQEEIEA